MSTSLLPKEPLSRKKQLQQREMKKVRSAIGAFEDVRKSNSTEFPAAEEPERRKTPEIHRLERERERV